MVALLITGAGAAFASAVSPADELLERIRALAPTADSTPNPTAVQARERYLSMNARADEQIALIFAFAEKFPTDPRRAGLLLDLAASPILAYQFKSVGDSGGEKGLAAVTFDNGKIVALRARVNARVAQLCNDPAVTTAERERAFAWWASWPAKAVYDYETRRSLPPDAAGMAEARCRIDLARAAFPESEKLASSLEQLYYRNLAKVDRAAASTWLQAAQNDTVRAVAEWAKQQWKVSLLLEKPIDLAFTALDGRAVDTKKLRGKVVLIDFWATWCRPCLAEMPNLKRVYAAYHDKGFEIIGITLESARVLTGDTPAQRAQKHAAARQLLVDAVAREGLDWPQFFDVTSQPNPCAALFGVTVIPATFLLDQDGKVVPTETRGEALDAEVRRLLKL